MADRSEPVIPEYRLRIDLDFAGLRWAGTVEFDLPERTAGCALDCEGLRVARVCVGSAPVPFAHDAAANRLTFDVPSGAVGPVAIDFAGTIETKNLFGFYRSRHGNGYLLTTHCEPTGARRIFPCVDRPDRKARIVLSVRAPADLLVIGNTPPRATRDMDGKREWTFEPTPEMSTYLFYLGAGQFDLREDRTSAVSIRVAAPPGRGEAAVWALRSAGRILHAYEEYYGIPYPLPKLDLIAVAEHAFGAMENWGAISFQETRLLVDEASSTFARRDVFETSAHEIAHQWFGNLVTMRTWDDIWLNESFASLMETKITEELEPSFDAWSDFFVRVAGKAAALDGDSLRATHPVRAHVERPEEMSQIFDEISYGKGSTVLAMLDRYLGEDRFRAGVTAYLRQHRYGNATTEDLFAALGKASGEPVAAIAGPWIDRPGLPLVRATRTSSGIRLSQSRFAYLGATQEPPWPIPMVLRVDGRPQRLLFDTREREIPVPPRSVVTLNPDSIGFFRVHYDPELLGRLLEVLPTQPGRDSWAVLDDLAAFVFSGDVDWPTYAAAVGRFSDYPERLTVETIAGALTSFSLLVPEAGAVARTAHEFLARQVERVGVDRRPDEPPGTGVLRDRLTYARVRADRSFAEVLSPRFEAWDRLDPDLKIAVAIAHVRAGGEAGYEAIRAAHARAASDTEAFRFERALAWSPRPEKVRELLDLAVAGKINRSHILAVCVQAAANPAGRATTWAWLQENLDALTVAFRGSGYLPLVLETTLPIIGQGRASEVRSFFDRHPMPEGTRGLAKALERLEILERLRARLG
jgi:tricorn protease interacting factor F2/3